MNKLKLSLAVLFCSIFIAAPRAFPANESIALVGWSPSSWQSNYNDPQNGRVGVFTSKEANVVQYDPYNTNHHYYTSVDDYLMGVLNRTYLKIGFHLRPL